MSVFLDLAPMCSFPQEKIAEEVMGCTTGAECSRREVGRRMCQGRDTDD